MVLRHHYYDDVKVQAISHIIVIQNHAASFGVLAERVSGRMDCGSRSVRFLVRKYVVLHIVRGSDLDQQSFDE